MALDIGRGSLKAFSVNWKGLDAVTAKINKEVQKIKGATVDGMLEAALFVQRDAQLLTPVDTGNLRASAYVIYGGGGRIVRSKSNPTVHNKKGKAGSSARFLTVASHNGVLTQRKKPSIDPYAEIGFTADYALAVHERLRGKGKGGKLGKVVSHAKFDKKSGKTFQIGQAKFLEQAFKQNSSRIIAIIRRRASIR